MSQRLLLPIICLSFALFACNLGQAETASLDTVDTPPAAITLTSSNVAVATTVPNSSESAANPTLNPTTPAACTPQSDWETYTVQPGDTLTAIASRTNSTVDELVAANCLDDADNIRRGQDLFVPVLPGAPQAGTPPAVDASNTVVLDLGIGLVLNYPAAWDFQPYSGSDVGGIIRNFPPEDEPPLAAGWPPEYVSVSISQIADEFASDDMETWIQQIVDGTNESDRRRITGGPFSQTLPSGLQTVRLDTAGGGPPAQTYHFITDDGANIAISVNGVSPQLAEDVINSIRPSG